MRSSTRVSGRTPFAIIVVYCSVILSLEGEGAALALATSSPPKSTQLDAATGSEKQAPSDTSSTPAKPSMGSFVVLEAYPADHPPASPANGYHASLDEDVVVIARNFRAWVDKLVGDGELVTRKNSDGTPHVLNPEDYKNYAEQTCLFLNEKPYPDLHPRADPVDDISKVENGSRYVDLRNQGNTFYRFQFTLSKTVLNKDSWMTLLRGKGIWDQPVDVTVGFYHPDNGLSEPHMESALNPALNSQDAKNSPQELFYLRPAPLWKLIPGICFVLLIALASLLLGHFSDLLRDTTSSLNPTGRYPFSLGMCQMAFWTLIVSASYIILGILIGEFETVSTAAVTLMGIATATGLGAVMINQLDNPIIHDQSTYATCPKTKKAFLKRYVELMSQLQTIDKRILANQSLMNSANGGNAAVQTALTADSALRADLVKSIEDTRISLNAFGLRPALISFALDLLREDSTVSFHRFQLIVWTAILGVVFAYKVYEDLAMPEFSASLLILVGISSSTYIGFKFPAAKSGSSTPVFPSPAPPPPGIPR